jgi:hypothetical protein
LFSRRLFPNASADPAGGIADLPGRKSVVLISDALRLTSPDELDPFLSPIYQSMRRVVDESVRAGVVLYAIDTRGLTSLRPLASDHLEHTPSTNDSGDFVAKMTQSRRDEYSDNQWDGIFLTGQTGGFMITESNRIDAASESGAIDPSAGAEHHGGDRTISHRQYWSKGAPNRSGVFLLELC